MKEKGYTLKYNPKKIDQYDLIVSTLPVNEHTIGKCLEIECPKNYIISVCGKDLGCNGMYSCNIKLFGQDNKEPFQDLHHSVPLSENHHVAAEIIVTKILNKIPENIDPKERQLADSMLKIIDSSNQYEYPMWAGIYKLFSHNNINNDSIFLNNSFNLYENEKMIFYVINPDIDIIKADLELTADIFEKVG